MTVRHAATAILALALAASADPVTGGSLAAAELGQRAAAPGQAAAEDGTAAGSLTQVTVSAEGNSTVIRLRAGPDAEVRDFLLTDPHRLVLDVRGAVHRLPGYTFGEIDRGGVAALRTSEFSDGVVRLVFRLTARPAYQLSREGGQVVVRFPNPDGAFEAWSTGTGASASGSPGAAAGGTEAGRVDGTSTGAAAGRTAEPVGGVTTGGAPGGTGPAPGSADQQQPRISVTYQQAAMEDVLAGFSEFAGVSIVPSDAAANTTVQGVSIREKPWDQALNAILQAHGLGWQRMPGGILMVDEVSALRGRDSLQTETRVFRINYADADSVANMLQELATDRGKVVSYRGTNSVIATDTPPAVTRMDSLVSVLDQRTPQVSIEAKIIFVDRTEAEELGIVYDLKDRSAETGFQQVVPTGGVEPGQQQPGQGQGGQQGQQRPPFTVDLGGPAVAALANANDRIASPALQILATTVFGDFALTSFIDALQSEQLSDVQAAPSIQVVDNHEARIQVGQRTPIRVLEPQAQLQQAQVNVQFEETGIILRATPHVTNNNQILLDLHAERSGISVGPSDLGFVFDTQEGDTRLLLDNGETGVIAGLTLSEVTKSRTGIPMLMDLPLVGPLFRTTRSNERKQDLIILVTPRIIQPGGTPAPGPGG